MTAYAAPNANVLIQAMQTYLQTTVVLPRSAIKSAIVGETGLALPHSDPVQFERADLGKLTINVYSASFDFFQLVCFALFDSQHGFFDDFQADLAGREGRHSVVSGLALDIATIPRISKKNLRNFCPPFKQLWLGCNMWIHRYCSDFKDAFARDNIATVLSSIPFVFFVVFGPTITMGNLYLKEVNSLVNLELCIIACGFFTATYALLSGQPAATVGPSGPCFIFEAITAQLSRSLQVPFPNFRFWIGIYMALFGMILVALNFSNLAKYARRSLEELFSSFVAFYFILKALFALFKARYWVGAFNVPLGMMFVTVMERIFFRSYHLPTLNIPKFNEISVSSITALKPKAKKPSPVIMDHILTNVAFPLICVFLGWPFVSGVPVRTTANTMALVKLEPHPPPGKPAQ
ncbi:unnamed protein product [Dibothriocephalus latus]|uniref:Bicarbonate transporter-like transmembrane domain-containing protein n=1 Tax=Dibothriocephalus latus TaxID=60516 RepID=A0A3P7LFQ5_DIBLA|nr:unnamed protein product [Dibothriocephalus latus]